MNKNFSLEKGRYETKGIASRLPLEYRILLWSLIDALNSTATLDYLQVFTFSALYKDNNITQRIVHSQEQPNYSCTYEFPTQEAVSGKVYVIDDGSHCVMLWAEEY